MGLAPKTGLLNGLKDVAALPWVLLSTAGYMLLYFFREMHNRRLGRQIKAVEAERDFFADEAARLKDAIAVERGTRHRSNREAASPTV